LFICTASNRAALVAVAGPIGAAVMPSLLPPLQRRVVAGVEAAAKVQMGHVFTVGHAYKLLDAGFYVKPATPAASSLTLRADEAARFVVRGLLSFVLVPLPWDLQPARERAYVPEQLAGYTLVVLMPLGAWPALGPGLPPAGAPHRIGRARPNHPRGASRHRREHAHREAQGSRHRAATDAARDDRRRARARVRVRGSAFRRRARRRSACRRA